MNDLDKTPYRPLGKHLKALRSRVNESLAEASGAVEIDVRDLASYELGKSRPSEDVLLLLISHFGAKDDEAVRLWEMAGYAMDKVPAAHMETSGNPHAVISNDDNSRVLYTDTVDIVVNRYGVVMNFMQNAAGKAIPVARIGMSREHAKSVLKVLQVTISQTEQSAGAQRPANDRKQDQIQ